MDATEPPALPELNKAADELTTLTEMLDFHRVVLMHRGWTLSQQQLATRLENHPSDLTIGGLLVHMALVEDWWFHHRFAGLPESEPWASAPDDDPDWDFHEPAKWSPDRIMNQFSESVERSRRVAADADSLDQLSARNHPTSGEHWNLRWIMVHMIEEYARHCGHADLLREAIDGVTDGWKPTN
jgi:hypothetical protein